MLPGIGVAAGGHAPGYGAMVRASWRGVGFTLKGFLCLILGFSPMVLDGVELTINTPGAWPGILSKARNS